jgi:hypothetical protein
VPGGGIPLFERQQAPAQRLILLAEAFFCALR